MKQIKFRAWQKYHERMVEVTSISFDDNGEINGVATFVENQAPQRINYKDGLLGGFFLKDERGMVLELMQYTGLKDKNGVEIFEGDIVRHSEVETDISIVRFGEFGVPNMEEIGYQDMAVGYYYENASELKDIAPFSMTVPVNTIYTKDVIVIGNIYENNDLLEEEK